MTENIPPHLNPLPPRGEGARKEIFTPLLSKSKKEAKTQHPDEKILKNISSSTYKEQESDEKETY